jgi:hypothetical protein
MGTRNGRPVVSVACLVCEIFYQQGEQEYRGQEREPEQETIKIIHVTFLERGSPARGDRSSRFGPQSDPKDDQEFSLIAAWIINRGSANC